MIYFVFTLFVVYQIKHFLADYPLQGRYMLGKFKGGYGWILPLLAHCAVHAAFTFVIAFLAILFIFGIKSQDLMSMGLPPDLYLLSMYCLKLSAIDGSIHFVMDRIKASPKMLGRYTALSKREMIQVMENMQYFKDHPLLTTTLQTMPQELAKIRSNRLFWWSLGLDQMVHHLTHYYIIYLILAVL